MAFGNVLGGMFGGNGQGSPMARNGYEANGYGETERGQYVSGGNFDLQTQNELYCLCRGTGIMFAKKGSMVAYQGNVKF